MLLGEDDTSPLVSTAEELNQYLADKPLPMEMAPLPWWMTKAHRYPRLSPIAREILGIPATSTPAERIFSTAGMNLCC